MNINYNNGCSENEKMSVCNASFQHMSSQTSTVAVFFKLYI